VGPQGVIVIQPTTAFAASIPGRGSRAFRAVGLAALVSALLPGAATAQEPGVAAATPAPKPEEKTTVRLASPYIPPEESEAFVTIMLDNIPAQQVQVIKSEIEYHTNQLTYVTGRLGFSGELASAKLEIVPQGVAGAGAGTGAATAAPQSAPLPPGRARLLVSVTGTKPIPNGPVVELRFEVARGLTSNPKVEHRAEAFTPADAKVQDLVVRGVDVRITEDETDKDRVPMIMACYFYMH
jgi:hypothetical protein